MVASPLSSLSERDSPYQPSLSDSETTDGFCYYQGRSSMRNRMPLTSTSHPITHLRTSPNPCPFGLTPFSSVQPPPSTPSIVPSPTSTIGMPPPNWSATVAKTIDSDTSATSSPSSKPRCILLKTTSQQLTTALKPPAFRPAFRIWKEGPGRRTTLRVDAPLGEEFVEDQEVQTRTGGDDTVLYPCLRVIRTNWA
jgi:hypothetical protein